MTDTIFDKIVRGEIPNYTIWEDDQHLAFLTPFPNTPGFTVVIPKTNYGDYVFSLHDEQYTALMLATKKVAEIIKIGLQVQRVALVFEGTGVAYVHAKLIPLHGELAGKSDVFLKETEFNTNYQGFITTLEGPAMPESELLEIQKSLRSVQNLD